MKVIYGLGLENKYCITGSLLLSMLSASTLFVLTYFVVEFIIVIRVVCIFGKQSGRLHYSENILPDFVVVSAVVDDDDRRG